MAKIVISDGKDSVQIEKDIESLSNKKVGDVVDGSVFGLAGYELVITGGSDKEGFPMRRDVSGMVRKRLLLTEGPGLRGGGGGVRRKKMVRGNVVSKDIAQLNTKVVKKGAKTVRELLNIPEKPKEKKEEAKAEMSEEKEKTEKKIEEKPEKEKKKQPKEKEVEAKQKPKEKPEKEETVTTEEKSEKREGQPKEK